jgi:acyl carrier protein
MAEKSSNSSDQLLTVFAEALNVSAETLTDDSSTETIPTWDSVAGMSLMVLLEETYDIAFEAEELAMLTSVGAVRRMLREKGVEI